MANNSSEYSWRQRIGFIVALPLFFLLLYLPAPADLSAAGWHVLATAALMASLWMTECIPIAVTALLPLVLFPFLQVHSFGDTARNYANSNIFLFMGGFFIAIAMQKWNLHRRIALYIILLVGSSPRRIVLGFMIATAFLSMWISNTATTMMMYPIGLAIIFQLLDSGSDDASDSDKSLSDFRTALMLGIAYAASIGGVATLIGTPPNIVFVSAVTRLYPDAPEIGFLDWFMVGVVLLIVFLPICWLLLTRVVYKLKGNDTLAGKSLIRNELERLGPMQYPEKVIAIVFTVTALAWMTRKDLVIGTFSMQGWASLFDNPQYLHDASVAMMAALFLFMYPVDLKTGIFILDWKSARDIPWGILILFGGGIALADGFRTSGLAEWIGMQLSLIGTVPLLAMIMLTCMTLTFMTELTSNVATTTLFMPILASTAIAIGTHPFLLMIPATISASCAFMLPVATPPNAIIFASGYVSIPQMAKTGILLNLIGIVLITLLTYLLVIPVFGISIDALPAWAR